MNISGIGLKIAEKLIEHFGTEDLAIDAIVNSNITEISSIRGIGMRKAIKIVSTFLETKTGVKKEDILKSPDIVRIHDQILLLLKSHAQTDYAKDKFSLLYPLPSKFQSEIQARLDYFGEARVVIERLGDLEKKIKMHLSKIKPLRNITKKIRRKKVIYIDDSDLYNRILEDEDLVRYCDIFHVERRSKNIPEILLESTKSYDLVFTIFQNYTLDGNFINIIPLEEIMFHKILPEFGVDIFASNSKMIKHAFVLAKIIHTLNGSSVIKEFKQNLSLKVLEEIVEFLEKIGDDGELSRDFNEEIFELRKSMEDFEKIMSDLELWLNQTITTRIEELEVKLDGNQILNILKAQGEQLDSSFNITEFLPSDVADIIFETLQKTEEKLHQKLHLKADDKMSINSVLLDESFSLPLEFDHEKLSDLKNQLAKKYYVKEHSILCSYQEKISRYETDLRRIIKTCFDFDEFFAVGCFARNYQANPPRLYPLGHGVAIQEGINLQLKKEELENPSFKALPIDYVLGKTDMFSGMTKDERVAVLSGANSGGKTCLLQTLAHIVLLAQMGLPVPARNAEVGLVDEIYYFAKSTGMVSAGAFETSLETFARISLSEHPRLVLLDELEAMTEPGAATKIIACLLEIFHQSPDITCCMVSHLAEQIMAKVQVPIRVDGIEAQGLKNGKLLVDRKPKYYYLAKSMPNLIVEKLCATQKAADRQFYKKIQDYLIK